jgi:hypothetical protein
MTMTHEEWKAEAIKRFGPDPLNWKFKCPSCGHVASVQDYREARAPQGAVAFSCIGRYKGSTKELGDKSGGPCNYTGGGLLNLNPVSVDIDGKITNVFAFAEEKAAE